MEDGRQGAHEGTLPRDAGPTSAAAAWPPGSRALRSRGAAPAPPPARYDAWLELAAATSCARSTRRAPTAARSTSRCFRALDADVWALLLTQEYDACPNIRALLPAVPDPALQAPWNGTSGAALAAQSVAFYRRLRDRYAAHGAVPLEAARVLDFGCGWGRLTRMLARDVAPGRLYGCDPAQGILDVCRADRVPADARPQRLPARSASRSTSRSTSRSRSPCSPTSPSRRAEREPRRAARRPRARRHPRASPSARRPDLARASRRGLPRSSRTPPSPSHPQWGGGEMTYGETVIPLAYVRERWSDRFALLDADILLGDLFQVVLTLRRS